MLLNKNIPWSYIVGKIRLEIAAVSIYAISFGIFHKLLNLHQITLPLSVPAIVGTVISLLLAFRSNQAYDRWWEARIIWGAIVNDSRTLVRQIKTFMNDPEYSVTADDFVRRFAKRQIMWCYSLGNSLRKKDPMLHARDLLSGDEQRFVAGHGHVPNALLSLHGKDIQVAMERGWLNPFQQVEIDRTLTRLCDAMGKCERIKNTVFPTTYGLYINFALYLFIILLPFGLTEYLGIVVVPLIILISASFLFIEKMAIHLQDPFENKPTDTPMTTIAATIEQNIREMMEDFNEPKHDRLAAKVSDEEFYVL